LFDSTGIIYRKKTKFQKDDSDVEMDMSDFGGLAAESSSSMISRVARVLMDLRSGEHIP